MPVYFAFGSNMSRPRLEARVGLARDLGMGRLPDHKHEFSVLGEDGTAKGNIESATGHEVLGVLYELRSEQLDLLDPYESGYERHVVEVHRESRSIVRAITYIAPPQRGLPPPSDEYLAHYRLGMLDHGFPPLYIEAVFGQAQALQTQ